MKLLLIIVCTAVLLSTDVVIAESDLTPACYICVDYEDVANQVLGCGCPLGVDWYSSVCQDICDT